MKYEIKFVETNDHLSAPQFDYLHETAEMYSKKCLQMQNYVWTLHVRKKPKGMPESLYRWMIKTLIFTTKFQSPK